MTRRYLVLFFALVAVAVPMVAARSDQYPTLNVAPLCHGITQQSDLQGGFKEVTFDECMKAEQEDRETMIKEWPEFTAAEKAHCVAEATMGGESSYTDLITCLEMARDVRLLKKTDKPDQSVAVPAQGPSTKRRQHRQPDQ